MIYKMTLKDSVDTMTFNLLETPIVDKDIEGAVDNVTLDGNQYTDYLYLKKQYIQKWAIMCPDEYDELRGFYTRQFEEGEVPSYRVYYGANVTRDYTLNGDYLQFNAEGIETGMTLSQLLGNAMQTTYSGKNLLPSINTTRTRNGVTFTHNEDGSISLSGTASADTAYPINVNSTGNSRNVPLSAGNYIVSGGSATSPTTVYMQAYYGTTGGADRYSTSTFTLEADGTMGAYIYVKSGANTTGKTIYPMVEQGSTATDYEQFVGGTASPNPDYPQPISTVTGEQNIEVVGKNLLGLQDDTLTSNGVDFAINNGTITASGTTTAASNAENDNVIGDLSRNGNYPAYSTITEANSIELRAGTYTVSAEITKTGETSAGIAFGTGATMGARITGLTKLEALINDATGTYTKTATFTIAEGERLYISTYYEGNATKKNVGFTISNIQLELGSTATAYESYQGQSYEINLGKNLFDKDNANILGGYIGGGNPHTISMDGSNTSIYIPCQPNTTYTISKVADNVFRAGTIAETPASGVVVNDYVDNASGTSITLTSSSNAKYIVVFLRNASSSHTQADLLASLQIERGSTATTYAPYFTPIELAKVGTYQDRIYKDDGKWYIEKQVGKVVFNGSETWSISGSVYYTSALASTIAPTPATEHYLGLSNYFEVVGFDYQSATNLFFHPNKNLQVKNTNWATLNDWKTWLASNPTTVYYALATPTTTEITDEALLYQLNFLASLYKGANNISLVGTGAQGEMEVFIRDVMSVETDVVPEVPVRLTLTDDGVINACGCRRNVQLTMRETTE